MDYDLVAPRFDPDSVQPRAPKRERPRVGSEPVPTPRPEEEAEVDEPVFTVNQVRDAFVYGIAPVPVTARYKLSLALVAAAMLALPVIYWGAAGGLAWGIYWHATANFSLISEISRGANGRGQELGLEALGWFALYLLPLVAGPLVLLYLIRPVFVSWRRARPFALDPSKEPVLFALVEELCRKIRAPMPRRIIVDCDLNASAGFSHGLWSMFGSGGLDLTIGLTLAAGLTAQEFAGVLAHELGHFAQGTGMRVTYVVRRINLWLAMIMLKFDIYRDALEDPNNFDPDVDIRDEILAWVTALFIWFGRCWVALLRIAGDAVSCLLLRQMEHDADRYEAMVAGSKACRQIMLKIGLLAFGANLGRRDLRRALSIHKLPENLPLLILEKTRQLPEKSRKTIAHQVIGDRARWFDTHPSGKERLARAAREAVDPAFVLEGPAAAFFADFDGLCKVLTFRMYREKIGPGLRKDILAPNSEVIISSESDIPAPGGIG